MVKRATQIARRVHWLVSLASWGRRDELPDSLATLNWYSIALVTNSYDGQQLVNSPHLQLGCYPAMVKAFTQMVSRYAIVTTSSSMIIMSSPRLVFVNNYSHFKVPFLGTDTTSTDMERYSEYMAVSRIPTGCVRHPLEAVQTCFLEVTFRRPITAEFEEMP